ncbi:hypothetical protein CLV51_102844 [Chitinophaga niastensis]|uniref:Uncharacterized protein n=1 Tax=Chitinophaga niastensis TaxID=536980 RepID=A0A2P8HP42_CHINA|nr:hypothetical protein [Chitinophaga niastensis]PSL47984.1 hypothetical protein CLV51_102844 [Chitinophaga niastensis]
MNGDKLIKYLGYSSNHPDLLAFLEAQEIDIHQLPDLSLPDKKLDKKKQVYFRYRGITLVFERDYPEQAEKLRRSDPDGSHNFNPEDFRIKNPVGDGPLYLDHIIFSKPEAYNIFSQPEVPEKPLLLPFGLQWEDNGKRQQQLFGPKNAHGDPKKPYYEEDESDYYHNSYRVAVQFNRFDKEEKLQELNVSLKK